MQNCREIFFYLHIRIGEGSYGTTFFVTHIFHLGTRRKCEGEFMDGHCWMDVTQSESDLPDFNQSEH